MAGFRLSLSAVAAVGALLAGPSIALAQEQCLSFRDSLNTTIERAPEIAAAQARSAEAEAALREARALRRPQVSTFGRGAVGDNGLSTSQIENQYGIRVSQRVYDFGDSGFALAAAQAEIDQQTSLENRERLSAARTVAEAYLTRLEAMAMIAVISERRDYFARQQAAVDALLAQGGATRAESAQIAAELAQAEAEMLDLQSIADRAGIRIAEYTGVSIALCDIDALENSVARAMSALPSVEAAVDAALNANPDIAARQASVRTLEAQRDRERNARLPVIELVGIVSYAYDDLTEDWNTRDRLGVDVSVPLYTGDAIGARGDQAQARLRGEEYALRAQQRDVREEAQISYRRQLSLRAQYLRRQAVADSQLAYFEAISGEFQFGLGTLPDLVEARLGFEQAELNVVRARFNLMREQLGLLHLTAQLLED